jgi:hypothetical protein
MAAIKEVHVKLVPNELILKMPIAVEATRGSCQAAADATLHVLFLMAGQLEPKLDFPPIISNGRELWKMPTPYDPPAIQTVPLLVDLNTAGAGEDGYLAHCKRNAQEFNEALEEAMPDVAKEIAGMGPTDSAHVWNYLNALACSIEDEAVYRALTLSPETKQSFYQAVGLRQ